MTYLLFFDVSDMGINSLLINSAFFKRIFIFFEIENWSVDSA